MPQQQLTNIELKGFKSIDAEGQSVDLTPVTVLLGANGAGKSNLVSFFGMLNYMTTGGLQNYVGSQGGADSLLHFGARNTQKLSGCLRFQGQGSMDEYRFELSSDATDRLFFSDETVTYHKTGKPEPLVRRLGGGAKESQVKEEADKGDQTCEVANSLLSQCRVFQFHDTSETAHIRKGCYIEDSRYLRHNAGNLAAFLYGLRNRNGGEQYYARIVRHVRQVVPQFSDFDLAPSSENERYIYLNWRETGQDYLFGPHQLSDGSLRFMALATLFLQPPELRPKVIVVDEPELGLHPAAISALAGMVKACPPETQVILATQSPRLVDEFSADQIVVVERDEAAPRTLLKRLRQEDLREWLEDYCLSELWEKNVLGGRP